MEQYIIDTNIVSDYISDSLPVDCIEFMDAVINAIPNISVITQIELLCWKTDKNTEQKVKNFVDDSNVVDITPDVIKHCVFIRKYKRIKTPDAIIAASTLAFNYTLITNNEKDFANVKGLKIINPRKLYRK